MSIGGRDPLAAGTPGPRPEPAGGGGSECVAVPAKVFLVVDAQRVPVEARFQLETGEVYVISLTRMPEGERSTMTRLLGNLPLAGHCSRWWG